MTNFERLDAAHAGYRERAKIYFEDAVQICRDMFHSWTPNLGVPGKWDLHENFIQDRDQWDKENYLADEASGASKNLFRHYEVLASADAASSIREYGYDYELVGGSDQGPDLYWLKWQSDGSFLISVKSVLFRSRIPVSLRPTETGGYRLTFVETGQSCDICRPTPDRAYLDQFLTAVVEVAIVAWEKIPIPADYGYDADKKPELEELTATQESGADVMQHESNPDESLIEEHDEAD